MLLPPSSMAEWSKLPNDILLLIAERVETQIDLLHFRSVCTSWRSSVHPRKPRCLKIPTYDPRVADHFYLSEHTIYLIELPENPDQTAPPERWFVKKGKLNMEKCTYCIHLQIPK
jgi:hypothetical protein